MEKKHFVLYLNPPRPDFAHTMTEEELGIMKEHVAYWKEYLDKGVMLVLGPVMHPHGVYGLGIVEVESEEQLHTLMNNDPATPLNTYEYYPMRAVTAKRQG